MYLFDLGGVDFILGVQWLRTLGDVKVNWDKMQMSFVQNSECVLLQGDPTLNGTFVSLQSLIKTSDVEFWGAIWAMEVSHGEGVTREGESNSELRKHLDEFEGV